MCMGCYLEAGSPKPSAEAIRVGLLLRPIDPFGGCHIVREDWNVEDEHIDFCMTWPETTDAERAVLTQLKALDEDQRYAAMAVADACIDYEATFLAGAEGTGGNADG